MKKTLAILSLLALPLAAPAQAAKGCLLAPEQLAKVLGGPFAAGKEEGDQGMMGVGCSYKGKGYDVWLITLKPAAFGATAEQVLKMSDPGQWKPVAGDPDGARHQIQMSGVSPFPSVAYERKGLLVKLRIVGPTQQPIADMNAKLLKLPRLP